jgi:drug/metabolite transporter (DMT)-like permease
VSAETASLLIATNPVFVYLLALGFLGERLRVAKVAGLALAFVGVYGLIRFQNGELGDTYLLHALVVLIAPLSWAGATVIGKPITVRRDPLLFTMAAMGIGSLPYALALMVGAGETHGILGTLPRIGWIALAHLSLGCSIVGYGIWFWALRTLPASSVAAFVFLNPPLTILFGIVWGTDAFHWSLVLFGLVVLSGVALSAGVLRPRSREPEA